MTGKEGTKRNGREGKDSEEKESMDRQLTERARRKGKIKERT